ncbi:hypothetical protein BE17_25175 [Sorangium cellulosum]|uniref:Extradiol ring-cleavage dioxygenase LigAB LigA subunit domain-containing protein n=1 Tax=Sorangium cellulosum TaxID=56 RepID=A0A150SKN2_SORCE|nr:hypothetical protein BE17_25175 [Sorangium cellulosum]
MTKPIPSARLIEFLDRVDDREFTKRFHSTPSAVLKEYGLSKTEGTAIADAEYFKGSSRAEQENALRKMFTQVGLDPDEHAALLKKLADNYDPAW